MYSFDKLQYFVGKVCTILTPATNRTFNDQQHANCFVGLVESVDEMGIWIEQLSTGRKSFFAAPLVGIIEEYFKSLSDDEAAAAKARITMPKSDRQESSVYIDPDELTRDWKHFKESR